MTCLFKETGSLDRCSNILTKFTDLGLNKGSGLLLKFLGALWIYVKIKVFLPVNAQLGWPDNVSGVPQAHFPGFLLVLRV